MEKFYTTLLAYFCRLPFNILSNCLTNEINTGHIKPLLLIKPLSQFVKCLNNLWFQT